MDERCARLGRAIDAIVSGDSAAVAELFTVDVVAWSPSLSVTSRVELAVEIEDYEDAFSEVDFAIGPFVSGVKRVCAEWVATATHSGPFALDRGCCASPTGRRVTLRGAAVAEFDGDQICGLRLYWDEIALLSELGLLSGTGSTGPAV
jgi:ketosteroid isomerase-like protein